MHRRPYAQERNMYSYCSCPNHSLMLHSASACLPLAAVQFPPSPCLSLPGCHPQRMSSHLAHPLSTRSSLRCPSPHHVHPNPNLPPPVTPSIGSIGNIMPPPL